MRPLFIPALLCLLVSSPLLADENALPEKSFPTDHYQKLWTKSPFIVATVAAPNGPVAAPSQYKLVGISRFSGIGYASIIDSGTAGTPGIFLEQNVPYKYGNKTLVLIGIEPGKIGQVCTAHISEDSKVIDLQTEPKSSNSLAVPLTKNFPGAHPPPPLAPQQTIRINQPNAMWHLPPKP